MFIMLILVIIMFTQINYSDHYY